MFPCRRCNGSGYQRYEEDGRNVRDACYHCRMTGVVDEDLNYHDRLRDVANTLAYNYVQSYKAACNDPSDEYGDDFALCAAENGMSERDYTTAMTYDYECEFAEKLCNMSSADQKLLIAWNEYVSFPPFKKSNVIVLHPKMQEAIDAIENADIPF
jgi:hypothetical protein